MRQLINLTPHAINIGDAVIAPSGTVARVNIQHEVVARINTSLTGPVKVFGKVGNNDSEQFSGLPTLNGEVDLRLGKHYAIYIVSAMVAGALESAYGEHGYVSPGALVRDEEGKVVGCEGLISYSTSCNFLYLNEEMGAS